MIERRCEERGLVVEIEERFMKENMEWFLKMGWGGRFVYEGG